MLKFGLISGAYSLLFLFTISLAQIRYALSNIFTSLDVFIGLGIELGTAALVFHFFVLNRSNKINLGLNNFKYSLAGSKGGRAEKRKYKERDRKTSKFLLQQG